MRIFTLLLVLFAIGIQPASAQTGPWAKSTGKIKGEALIRDADGGYLKEVQSIVEGGGDVNWTMERSGTTPLMAAAGGGHLEIVKFLLSKGANPKAQDANGKTALDRAQSAGASDVVAFLKNLNTNGTLPSKDETIKTLPKTTPTGPWANYNGKMKGEALIREASGGYINEVKSIVAGGGDVNWQIQGGGTTPLMAASSGGHVEVVAFLLANGADPNIKDANGRTALDLAQMAGANDVVALLKSKHQPAIATETKPVETNEKATTPAKPTPVKKPETVTPVAAPKNAALPALSINSTKWAPFGTYKVGSKVMFFIGSWKPGTVIEVGQPGDYAVKNAAPKERKYLIAREGAPNWNEWMDWGSVTGTTREDYWTGFFTGSWSLGETMAVNTRVEGAQQRDEYTFHSASEALNVSPNNTYIWKTITGKTITGAWKPAADGAGIVLLNASQGINWTLRNETNASEENIRGLETARLTADGKMSIKAQRPIK